MNNRIAVLVVEDHKMVAEMMMAFLDAEGDIKVVGRAGTVAEACVGVDAEHVDVVLMDYRLPDGDGIKAAAQIRSTHPETRIVIVTAFDDGQLLEDALARGCSGFVRKGEAANVLAAAVRAAHAGAMAISPGTLLLALQRDR